MRFSLSVALVAALASVLSTACAAEEGAQATIGRAGGEVWSDDGRLQLQIEPETFDEDTLVSVVTLEGCTAGGLACYAVEPAGLGLRVPGHLRYFLDGDETLRMNPKKVAFFVEDGQTWSRLPDRRVDLEEGIVAGSALYLSTFTVLDGR